jgi:hypothetical protein
MKAFFLKQGWHFLALAVLLAGVVFTYQWIDAGSGELWQISTGSWYWLAILIPVVHQIYVWLSWRAELGQQWLTRRWGKNALPIYGRIFMPLFAGRLFSLLLVAISNANSLEIPSGLRIILAILLAIPSIYLGYSVSRYFGIKRALGADHFDPAYRTRPLVKEGIFKYTDNGMYVYGFFILWAIGIGFASKAALIAAGFNHLYIWVHYFTVEKPDMELIYGKR